ncbi:MAG: 16S rRNA (guanine(527)-N(7))-methyltransferase RsmG [Acholeplasmataceae bacterium]|jgi:16S rRNA (guanine527-N7)-methyltransferase|nr:16S rRNA (guanine(527)-N(7))-methyltransferase RsmG [Acholeplasmataceae bacterium]
MFKDDINSLLNIEITDEQLKQFDDYYHFLIVYNNITNLTRITDQDEVFYKHFYDSLTLTNVIDFKTVQSICDMGAGAGFPSIPLKIMYPHLSITIVDSLGKRITFLEQLIEKLNLTHVSLFHDRSEIFAKTHQASFDVVTARALGNLNLILEMGMPMVKKDGFFIAPKGQNYEVEVTDATKAINLLGARIIDIKTFELPYSYGKRANILLKKIKHINGYPRSYSQMLNKPL